MAFLQQCAFFATGMHNYHTYHNVLHIYHTPSRTRAFIYQTKSHIEQKQNTNAKPKRISNKAEQNVKPHPTHKKELLKINNL